MKKLSLITVFLAACLAAQLASAQTITLKKTEKLVPQGWTVADDDLKFKKDTQALLNDDGEVVSGILNSDTYLRPTGWQSVINDYCYVQASSVFFPRFFRPVGVRYGVALPTYGHVRYKSGSLVHFAKDGTVLSGTIDERTTVALQKDRYGFVDFKADTVLTFDAEGHIISGTLADDTRLRPSGWQKNRTDAASAGFLEFKGNRTITFDTDGYVTSGTVKEAGSWKNADGETITLPAKANVRFTADGAEIIDPKK